MHAVFTPTSQALLLLGNGRWLKPCTSSQGQPQNGPFSACLALGATSASSSLELAPGHGHNYFPQKRHKNRFRIKEVFLSEMKADFL